MTYPDKLYIELKKTPFNKKKGISGGQTTMIKNFNSFKVNISRKMDDARSGIDYRITRHADYPDMLELEFTRIDKLPKR